MLLPDVLESRHSLCGFDVCTSEDLCGLSVPDKYCSIGHPFRLNYVEVFIGLKNPDTRHYVCMMQMHPKNNFSHGFLYKVTVSSYGST